nr:putative glycosidase crf1 [Quercus suber]
MRFTRSSTAAIVAALPFTLAQTSTDCNPTEKTCPSDVGLEAATYNADFTQPNANASWTAADGTVLAYSSQGAEFSIDTSTDAPTFSTDFYFLFGRVDVKMKASTGTGIVSSVVLESDDLDEIDWEWLGGDSAQVQTNFFGKGNTTSYDRGTYQAVSTPQATFHTYSFDWTADRLQWLIDGTVVRTLNYDDDLALNGKNYPQTPMRLKLGSWCGGCSSSEGTVSWAGGKPTFNDAPYVMYVETVAITNYNPATSYVYSDMSGDWQSITINKGSDSSSVTGSSSTDTVSAAVATSTTSVVGSATVSTSVDSTATAAPTSMIAVSGLQDHSGVVQSTTIIGSSYSMNSASISAQNSGTTLITTSAASTGAPSTSPSSTNTSSFTSATLTSTPTGSPTNDASTLQKSVLAGSLMSMALACDVYPGNGKVHRCTLKAPKLKTSPDVLHRPRAAGPGGVPGTVGRVSRTEFYACDLAGGLKSSGWPSNWIACPSTTATSRSTAAHCVVSRPHHQHVLYAPFPRSYIGCTLEGITRSHTRASARHGKLLGGVCMAWMMMVPWEAAGWRCPVSFCAQHTEGDMPTGPGGLRSLFCVYIDKMRLLFSLLG